MFLLVVYDCYMIVVNIGFNIRNACFVLIELMKVQVQLRYYLDDVLK